MTDKDKYRALCAVEESIPVFSRDWWLDCVCEKADWDVVLVETEAGIQAAMPYYLLSKHIISMPAHTQTMGPWLRETPSSIPYSRRLVQRQQLCEKLIAKLPKHSHFFQCFNYRITDWLPFYWHGFKQTTRYTYLLTHIQDTQQLWDHFSTNTQRNIRKARDKYQLSVKKGIPANEFIRIQAKTFRRQHLHATKPDLLYSLIETCRCRGQGDIWGAYDTEGNLHAAVLVVWQPSSAYYLAGGGDPAFRASGAHSLVMWEAIRGVRTYTDTFDFEGSMIRGVEHFFREFGATQTPFFTIYKGKLSLLHRGWFKMQGVMRKFFA